MPAAQRRSIDGDPFDMTAEEQAEMDALLASFDERLTIAEKRIDRVLARLGVH
jgi:hypothetical protein